MNELTVLLPAYNEAANIETLVDRWQQFGLPLKERYSLSLQIVVVNDGSTDETKLICEKLKQKYTNFTLINHNENKGLGQAVKTAVTYVIRDCPNSIYACLMDCDNTHAPKYVMNMLQRCSPSPDIPGADVVVASRYQRGAKIKGVSKYRLYASESARYVYSLLLNLEGVKDYTCGYRLYSKNILVKVYNRFGSDIIQESGFSCMAELLYKLSLVNARFAEIPFELRYDYKLGQSKMKVVKTAINSIKLALRLRKLNLSMQSMQKDIEYEYVEK